MEPPVRICPGCPTRISVDSSELQEALAHSLKKLNAENNEPYYFKTETVKSATVQVCKSCCMNRNVELASRLLANFDLCLGSGLGNS